MAVIEQETIRAVIEAYAEGKIELPQPGPNTRKNDIRYAPSFKRGAVAANANAPFTVKTLAEFIGWLRPSGQAQEKVTDGLTALEFIEEGTLSESDFEGLSTTQAQAVIKQVRKTRKRREEPGVPRLLIPTLHELSLRSSAGLSLMASLG